MKSNYEERKANRLEAFQDLANKNEQNAADFFKRAKEMASVIPFGQPILVGHHSEKRDRNYRGKIHNTFGKSFAASDKAEYYKQRAETLLNGTAISSDDPSAIDKLTEKLEGLEATQELYKAINKIVRSNKTGQAEKIVLLEGLGLKQETAVKVVEPDQWGRVGIPSYRLSNNNAVISNTKKRIEQLSKLASLETTEEEINGVRLVVNAEDNRVQIFFPGKPSEEVRTKLKKSGFHWAPSVGAWMRQISNWAIREAKEILQAL